MNFRSATGAWSCLIALLGSLFFTGAAAAGEAAMNAEIDHLVAAVADLAETDCVFFRNGKEHPAEDAVDHLEMKRKRGKRYFDTTEEFIDRIASKSSWSGKDYLIWCSNAEPVTAGEWFFDKLADYRDESPG